MGSVRAAHICHLLRCIQNEFHCAAQIMLALKKFVDDICNGGAIGTFMAALKEPPSNPAGKLVGKPTCNGVQLGHFGLLLKSPHQPPVGNVGKPTFGLPL